MLIVNFNEYGRKEKLTEKFGDRWLYIGRKNRRGNFEPSPLANPFKRTNGMRPGDTLQQYRQWLWQRIQARDEAVLGELRKIDEGSVLVCWCKPGPCHGDVVMAAAKWLRSQEK
jgi:hypothetical protein